MEVSGSRPEAPKLVGKGTSIVLGGSPMTVRFDMESFVYLEERWGSLKAFWEELQKGHEGRMYTCIRDAICATVRGLPVDPGSLMDSTRIVEYAEAIAPAFMEAMPDVAGDEAGQAQTRQADRPLTGAPSSTPESSASGWRPPTSGI